MPCAIDTLSASLVGCPFSPLRIILIVDDSPEICELLSRYILDTGAFETLIARSVEEARKVFEPGKFFAVILDLNLGQSIEDGMELAREFRRQDEAIYIAVISGYEPPFDDRLLESINDIMSKPIDYAVLRAKLMMWTLQVNQRRARQQYFDAKFLGYEAQLKRICETQQEIDAQLTGIEVLLGHHHAGGANGQAEQ